MARTPQTSQAIIQILHTQHTLSALDILAALTTAGHTVNKTTVYRALDQLERSAILCKQTLAGNEVTYELREDHHDHIVCQACGKVDRTACLTKTPKTIRGFRVDHHHTTIYGLCANCVHGVS